MNIKEFENATRYEKDMDGSMCPHPDGDYVHADTYFLLLDKYKNLVDETVSTRDAFMGMCKEHN